MITSLMRHFISWCTTKSHRGPYRVVQYTYRPPPPHTHTTCCVSQDNNLSPHIPRAHSGNTAHIPICISRHKTTLNAYSGLCTILRAYLSAVTLFGCKGLPSASTPDGRRCRPCDLFPSVYSRRLRSVYRGMTGERTRISFEGWLDGEGGGVRTRHRARTSPALHCVGRSPLVSPVSTHLGVLVRR